MTMASKALSNVMKEINLDVDEYERYRAEIAAVMEAVGLMNRHIRGDNVHISCLSQPLQPRSVNVPSPMKTHVLPTAASNPAVTTTTATKNSATAKSVAKVSANVTAKSDATATAAVTSKATKPPKLPKAVPQKSVMVKKEAAAADTVREHVVDVYIMILFIDDCLLLQSPRYPPRPQVSFSSVADELRAMLSKKYNRSIPRVASGTIPRAERMDRASATPLKDTSEDFVKHLDVYIRRAVQSEDTAYLISQLSYTIEGYAFRIMVWSGQLFYYYALLHRRSFSKLPAVGFLLREIASDESDLSLNSYTVSVRLCVLYTTYTSCL